MLLCYQECDVFGAILTRIQNTKQNEPLCRRRREFSFDLKMGETSRVSPVLLISFPGKVFPQTPVSLSSPNMPRSNLSLTPYIIA